MPQTKSGNAESRCKHVSNLVVKRNRKVSAVQKFNQPSNTLPEVEVKRWTKYIKRSLLSHCHDPFGIVSIASCFLGLLLELRGGYRQPRISSNGNGSNWKYCFTFIHCVEWADRVSKRRKQTDWLQILIVVELVEFFSLLYFMSALIVWYYGSNSTLQGDIAVVTIWQYTEIEDIEKTLINIFVYLFIDFSRALATGVIL